MESNGVVAEMPLPMEFLIHSEQFCFYLIYLLNTTSSRRMYDLYPCLYPMKGFDGCFDRLSQIVFLTSLISTLHQKWPIQITTNWKYRIPAVKVVKQRSFVFTLLFQPICPTNLINSHHKIDTIRFTGNGTKESLPWEISRMALGFDQLIPRVLSRNHFVVIWSIQGLFEMLIFLSRNIQLNMLNWCVYLWTVRTSYWFEKNDHRFKSYSL